MSVHTKELAVSLTRIAFYAVGAGIMGRYGMPWYASLGTLLIIIVGARCGITYEASR